MRFTSVAGHLMECEFDQEYRAWNSCEPGELFDARILKVWPPPAHSPTLRVLVAPRLLRTIRVPPTPPPTRSMCRRARRTFSARCRPRRAAPRCSSCGSTATARARTSRSRHGSFLVLSYCVFIWPHFGPLSESLALPAPLLPPPLTPQVIDVCRRANPRLRILRARFSALIPRDIMRAVDLLVRRALLPAVLVNSQPTEGE